MSDVTDLQAGNAELRVFATIATSLRLLLGDLPVIFSTAVVILSPSIVLSTFFPEVRVTGIVNSILISVLAAVLSVRVVNRINGVRSPLLADARHALGRDSRFLIVSFIAGLAVILGLVVLVIPGLIIYTIYLVVIPVACLERRKVSDCFSRSMELTKGRRWRVFGVILVQLLISIALVAAYTMFVTSVIGIDLDDQIPWGWHLGFEALGCLLAGFQAVMVTVVYASLRQLKDGVDSHRIAEVFS